MKSFKTFLQELVKPKQIKTFKDDNKHITSVDSRSQDWQGTLPELMNTFGFKPLGTGKYGSVFGNAEYPFVIKVFMKDTAYLKWLNFAKDNQNNPWVPKIKGKVIRIGNIFMAVRLEKLQPYNFDLDSQDMLYLKVTQGDEHAKKIIDFIEKNDNLLDWHDGNVMLRGKQIVIIDPFYNWFKGGRYTISADNTSEFKNIFVKP